MNTTNWSWNWVETSKLKLLHTCGMRFCFIFGQTRRWYSFEILSTPPYLPSGTWCRGVLLEITRCWITRLILVSVRSSSSSSSSSNIIAFSLLAKFRQKAEKKKKTHLSWNHFICLIFNFFYFLIFEKFAKFFWK